MSYCVNCGATYEVLVSLCNKCHFDQQVPEGIIDLEVSREQWHTDDPVFGYPGEGMAQALSAAVALILGVVLGVMSFGIFVALVVISLVQLKIAHVVSQKNMIRVGPTSFQHVHRIAKVASFRLKLSCPEIYISQAPDYNAYTQGFVRHGFIVMNSALVEDFQPAELLFVIGHEMGHVKRLHTTWLTLLHPARVGGARFWLAPVLQVIFNVWSVKAEYTADQAGLIATGDVDPACRALLKLSGGSQVEKEVDLQSIRGGGRDDAGLGGVFEYLGDHPFIQSRVRHVLNYAESRQYSNALWWHHGKASESGFAEEAHE